MGRRAGRYRDRRVMCFYGPPEGLKEVGFEHREEIASAGSGASKQAPFLIDRPPFYDENSGRYLVILV